LQVLLAAPRPSVNDGAFRAFPPAFVQPFQKRADATVFHAHDKVILAPGQNGAALKVTLPAVQLLELTGTVLDANQRPIADAGVYLFTGDVNPGTWVSTFRPSADGGSITVICDRLLTCTKTDAKERYSLWTVREDPASPLVANSGHDFTQFGIGVSHDNRTKLITRIQVPKDGKVKNEIQMNSENPCARSATRSRIGGAPALLALPHRPILRFATDIP
jgi:hypothetical protein